ncbi:hypothetical protein TDB9533_03602 [Thalassocella blandensis]|nr:hypothetical protein TDB9533_03602 [Thalassocella blandensis]
MKYISKLFILSGLILASSLTFAESVTTTYDFDTQAFNGGQIQLPELNFEGPASGSITTRYSYESGNYSIDKVVVNFDSMPRIVAQSFTKLDNEGHSFQAHVNNAWIFRSVKVMLHFPNGISQPSMAYLDISVDYNTSFIGSPLNNPAAIDGPLLTSIYIEPVERRTFSTIDVYRTTVDNKAVILKLNKHPIRTTADGGWPLEGFELKVTWYGHGEGTYLFEAPTMPNIKPVVIMADQFEPNAISIGYQEDSYTGSTPPIPLEVILQEAILNSNAP